MTEPTPITSVDRAAREPCSGARKRQDNPWDLEYGRDVWRLRALGIHNVNRAHLSFAEIPQQWLKELAKRWARWRLATGQVSLHGFRGLPASGPATTSNRAFIGAGPSRRRRSRRAFSDGHPTGMPASPAVSFAQTRAYPSRGNIPNASRKYTPVREGRSRSLRCTVLVCSKTSSTNSKGRY